jgi:mRNA interferase MazF
VNDDAVGILPLKVIVPITDWKEHYKGVPWMVQLFPNPENGLTKVSAADTFQVRSLSQKRFVKKVGYVSPELLVQVSTALATVLALD